MEAMAFLCRRLHEGEDSPAVEMCLRPASKRKERSAYTGTEDVVTDRGPSSSVAIQVWKRQKRTATVPGEPLYERRRQVDLKAAKLRASS